MFYRLTATRVAWRIDKRAPASRRRWFLSRRRWWEPTSKNRRRQWADATGCGVGGFSFASVDDGSTNQRGARIPSPSSDAFDDFDRVVVVVVVVRIFNLATGGIPSSSASMIHGSMQLQSISPPASAWLPNGRRCWVAFGFRKGSWPDGIPLSWQWIGRKQAGDQSGAVSVTESWGKTKGPRAGVKAQGLWLDRTFSKTVELSSAKTKSISSINYINL